MDTPRIRQTHLPTILICLLFSIIHIQPVFAQAKCYSMLGSLIKDPGVIPCNPLASNTTGTHSSCCNQKTGDVCLSSGLCLSPSGKEPSTMLWTNGCTDPTWKDRSCPRYCNPPFNSTGDVSNPTFYACTPKMFCCRGYYSNDKNNEECCRNSFSLSQGMGRIERILLKPDDPDSSGSPSKNLPPNNLPSNNPSSENPSNNPPSTPSDPSLKPTTITAGILGTLLLAVSTALGLMVLQNRRLKKSLADEQARAAVQQLQSPGDNMDYYKYYHQGQVPQEVADPHYSPPAWVPSELPTAERRGQLES